MEYYKIQFRSNVAMHCDAYKRVGIFDNYWDNLAMKNNPILSNGVC